MNSIFALENFNNYFNRKVIKYDTLDEYLQHSDKYEPLAGVNFNPADGVNTSYILNTLNDVKPDYLLVVDEYNRIVSRWFVVDANRMRNGQYKLSLLRDVIAEHYTEVIDAPCLVKRAMVDIDNPLLYNAESDNKFNQIKQSEHLLKDETGTNWIVGYIARDTNIEGDISSIKTETESYTTLESLDIVLNNSNDPSQGAHFTTVDAFQITAQSNNLTDGRFPKVYADFDMSGTVVYPTYQIEVRAPMGYFKDCAFSNYDTMIEAYYNYYRRSKNNIIQAFSNKVLSEHADFAYPNESDTIKQLNGRVVYSIQSKKYYRMKIGNAATSEVLDVLDKNHTIALYQEVQQVAMNIVNQFGVNYGEIRNPFQLYYKVLKYDISFEEVVPLGAIKTHISNTRQHLIDAPFDMFAIPYTEDNYNLAQQINLKLATNIYDIQLLPYCPVREMISADNISLTLGKKDINYSDIIDTSTGQAVSYILWATKSSNIFRIKHKIAVPTTNTDLKVYSETTFARIVSPNYNGIFEFNPAKNGGVDYFEVSFTYKPYSPYIHVNPNFKGLYGQDFNDARGLQCNGDFSVSMTSDAWRQYEINNKNYQNIFNTEIKTMDENQMYQNISSGISSAIGGLSTGVMAGLLGGLPLGIFSGIASGMAGAGDMVIQNKMYQNNRQAKIDTFNLSLGNIKARPDSLTKVSAHTITNKYFPFVEIYSATDVEKSILKNKITYYGMNINALGKISDFINVNGFSYFSGTLIRLDSINDDSHVVNQIAQELDGGLYF